MDSQLRSYILLRDEGCAARFVNSAFDARRWPMLQGLPSPGVCRNEFGSPIPATGYVGFTIDHINNDLQVRADHPDRLWTLCAFHHGLARTAGEQWATKSEVRAAAALYAVAANEAARLANFPPADSAWWAA